MKHLLFSICIAILFTSCKQEVKIEKEVAIENEIEAIEPKDPKETEVWKPIPPTVNPTGQNGVPSDAIVLFDGTNFNEWINAADSTDVKWKLNKEENIEDGRIGFHIFKFYLSNLGGLNVFLLIILFLTFIGLRFLGDIWLAWWLSDQLNYSNQKKDIHG